MTRAGKVLPYLGGNWDAWGIPLEQEEGVHSSCPGEDVREEGDKRKERVRTCACSGLDPAVERSAAWSEKLQVEWFGDVLRLGNP